MSTGTGLTHSEFNHSRTEPVHFFQTWVFPKGRKIKPRYDQKTFHPEERQNQWQVVVSPNKDSQKKLWINQGAYLALSRLEGGKELPYQLHGNGYGAYLFVLEGTVEVEGQVLEQRDALSISETETISLKATDAGELLLIEIPMLG